MAEFKQWRNENRTPLKDVIPLDTPYNIGVDVSTYCNARCIYCAHSKKNHGVYEGNMSMELFQKVLEEVKQFPSKLKCMELFGFGEPFCNPKLEKMVAKAKSADIADKINITTNGLLFTPERIDALVNAGIDIIRVSLQGLDAETYKKVCGVDVDFDKFINNLTYLYEHRGTSNVRMKIADVALADVPDGKEKFIDMFGPIADTIFVEHIIPMFSAVDYSGIDSDIYKNAVFGRENVKQNEIHKVCHFPFYRLRISLDGGVYASCCDTPNDILYGNINDKHLKDIWQGSIRTSFLKMQLKGDRFKHPVCKNCMLPNDITTEADIIDPYAEEILNRF